MAESASPSSSSSNAEENATRLPSGGGGVGATTPDDYDENFNPHVDAWKGDIWAKLAANAETRKYIPDPTFVAAINSIQKDPENELRRHMGDPRIMQVQSLDIYLRHGD